MSPNYGLGVDPVNQVHSFDITKWSQDHVQWKVCKPEIWNKNKTWSTLVWHHQMVKGSYQMKSMEIEGPSWSINLEYTLYAKRH